MLPSFPPVRACIFDMDGLLIDSEDIYTLVVNEILHEYGKPNMPWSVKATLQGRPGPEVCSHLLLHKLSIFVRPFLPVLGYLLLCWPLYLGVTTLTYPKAYALFHEWAQLPLSKDEYFAKQSELQRQYFPSCQPMPGVPSLLRTLSGAGIHIALASSSHKANYELKTSHLSSLFSQFPESQRVLGDDPRIKAGRGKPSPDIYLLALDTINSTLTLKGGGESKVLPEECLVFEDSVPGVEAGRRAGMRVVWCPLPGLRGEFKGREAKVLAGRCEDENRADDVGIGAVERPADALRGWPSKVDDAWGEQLDTLENFPYEKYGITVGREG